jgi:hypothetical protein
MSQKPAHRRRGRLEVLFFQLLLFEIHSALVVEWQAPPLFDGDIDFQGKPILRIGLEQLHFLESPLVPKDLQVVLQVLVTGSQVAQFGDPHEQQVKKKQRGFLNPIRIEVGGDCALDGLQKS